MIDKINNLKLNRLEVLGVQINLENSNIDLITIYRAPNVKVSESLTDIERILSQVDNEKTIICGDFNFDLLKQNIVIKEVVAK